MSGRKNVPRARLIVHEWERKTYQGCTIMGKENVPRARLNVHVWERKTYQGLCLSYVNEREMYQGRK